VNDQMSELPHKFKNIAIGASNLEVDADNSATSQGAPMLDPSESSRKSQLI